MALLYIAREILKKINSSVAVTGPLTNTELRATPVDLSAFRRTIVTAGDDASLWTAQTAAIANLATNTTDNHIMGAAIEYDKIAGNTSTLLTSTLASAVDLSWMDGDDVLEIAVYLSSVVDVATITLYLGTDLANVSAWQIGAGIATGWNTYTFQVDSTWTANLGNGWAPSSVPMAGIDIAFNAAGDVLTDIAFSTFIARAVGRTRAS